MHDEGNSSNEKKLFCLCIQVNTGILSSFFFTFMTSCHDNYTKLLKVSNLYSLSMQLVIVAFVAMTVFIRTRMTVDVLHGNYFMGSLFYSLIILLVDGFPELSMTVSRLAVIYKQKELCFFPAWAYTIPSAVLKIPLSLLESFIWTTLSYYVIG